MNITVKSGVPQGGTLSPMLFTLALDHCLMKEASTAKMIEEGEIAAFADDIVATVHKDDTYKIRDLVHTLKTHGFRTNPEK